jgi:hypothetical protein
MGRHAAGRARQPQDPHRAALTRRSGERVTGGVASPQVGSEAGKGPEQRGVLEAGDEPDPVLDRDQHHDAVGAIGAVGGGQVGGQRRLPVGARGHQPNAVQSPGGGHGAKEPRDLLAAQVPQGLGRHLQDGVLGQHGGKLLEVASLPGQHEAAQDVLLLGGQRRGRAAGGRPCLSERGPGALEGAVDGRHRGLQQLGGLGGAPAQHLPQDEHGSLPRRELLQGHHEGQRHRLALLGDRSRVGAVVGQVVQEPVRVGLQPRHLGTLRSGRDAATPAGLEHPQAGGGGDPVQPGAQRSASLEGVQVPPGPQQGLLGGVLGVVEGAQHPVAVHVQLTDMRRHQQPEPRLVARQRRPEQLVGARFGRC